MRKPRIDYVELKIEKTYGAKTEIRTVRESTANASLARGYYDFVGWNGRVVGRTAHYADGTSKELPF